MLLRITQLTFLAGYLIDYYRFPAFALVNALSVYFRGTSYYSYIVCHRSPLSRCLQEVCSIDPPGMLIQGSGICGKTSIFVAISDHTCFSNLSGSLDWRLPEFRISCALCRSRFVGFICFSLVSSLLDFLMSFPSFNSFFRCWVAIYGREACYLESFGMFRV